jgi:putative flippase GtrA
MGLENLFQMTLIPSSFLKFSFIGLSALIVDNLAIYLAFIFKFNFIYARALTFILTFSMSYFLNCKFSFGSIPSLINFKKFAYGVGALNFLSMILSYLVYYFFPELNPLFSLNFGAICIFLINYLYQKKIFSEF